MLMCVFTWYKCSQVEDQDGTPADVSDSDDEYLSDDTDDDFDLSCRDTNSESESE